MNKKMLGLLLSGMMIIPMTGCNAHLTIGGKEIFNFSDEKEVQQEITHEHNADERKYTDEEILSSLKEGTFVVNYKDTEYKFILETLLNELYEDTTYTVTYIGNNVYNIQVGNSDNSKFMEFELIGGTTTLSIVSYYDGNTLYTDEDANAMFTNAVVNLIENENKKQEEAKKEEKQEETKKEEKQVNEGFYIGSDGNYHCNYCHEIPSKEEYNSICDCQDPMKDGHMESTAPYGRCPKCNCANASDKGYQGDYCDDCYAQIKQEDYEEKHKYGDCPDCGVYLSESEANSYGGRCAECYSRYYGNDNPNMGRCERCDAPVDLDYTNEGWGYSQLCPNCTGELQMEESMQDSNSYAG